MTVFGDYLKRVRIKSIKIGPITWEISPTVGSKIKEHEQKSLVTSQETQQQIERDIKELADLIYSLENFHSNPEGIYYIGQTLIRCDSFLEDNGIVGDPLNITLALIEEIDDDTRKDEGLFNPVLSVSKINRLKKALKSIRSNIILYQEEP
jgi:hypothetical protein